MMPGPDVTVGGVAYPEWASEHPRVQCRVGSGSPVFGSEALGMVALHTTYEARPEYVGFHIAELEYGKTCEPFDKHVEATHKAKAAWGAFAEFTLHELGVTLPEGRFVVLMDE